MTRRPVQLTAGLLGGLALLVAGGLWSGRSHQPVQPAQAATTDTINLAVGCNNVASTFSAGAAVSMLAAGVSQEAGLEAVWHYINEERRFVAWSPLPGAPNDYENQRGLLEAIFLCVRNAGTFTRPDR